MLHEIRLPDCEQEMRWIVDLQRRLLCAVCDPNTSAADVTVEWVKNRLDRLNLDDKWLKSLCLRHDRITRPGHPLIEHLQAIADFPAQEKQQLLDAFENDHRFLDQFGGNTTQQLHGIQALVALSPAAEIPVRGLLETFYDPMFYKGAGYPIVRGNGPSDERFHKDIFLERFARANEKLSVCPYCDGYRGAKPEVDHYYPKSKYPQLSCHPLNLVPVCDSCNSTTNKGSKIPLDLDAPDPMADWFHPYLRRAGNCYSVEFVTDATGKTEAVLRGSDAQAQRRLDNWRELVGLRGQWQHGLRRKTRAAQAKLRGYKRRNTGPQPTKEDICRKLREWAENTSDLIGIEPFAILEHHYYRAAATQEPALFDELWVYVTEAMP